MFKIMKGVFFNQKIFYCFLLFLFCAIVNYSFDYTFRIIYVLALFLILILLKDAFKYVYCFCVVLLALLSSIYFPIGKIFGAPSYNTVLSIFSTNYIESIEFLSSIPLFYYLSSLFILILAAILLVKKDDLLPVKGRKWLLLFSMIICFHGSISRFFSGGGFHLSQTGLPPVRFILESYQSIKEVQKDNKRITSVLNHDTWGNISSNPHYLNYILVIGESARRDFMHTYGFQIKNTPFSDQAKGVFFTNYFSAGPSTLISLMNTLALHENDQLQLQNSIISLANKAGFKTYWLSNQVSRGSGDVGIANFARKAQISHFLNEGSWSASFDYSSHENGNNDKNLLPLIQSALDDEDHRPKLIIIHLMGSHPPPCKRTQDQFDVYFRSKDLSCYVQSIKNTDALLEKIAKMSNEKSTNGR